MAAFDFKKEYKNLYSPKPEPEKILVPPMTFLMTDGAGNPAEAGGAFEKAVGLLYALSYTIKMSGKGGRAPEGFFEYAVAPLEGLWWMADGFAGVDYQRRQDFRWTAMIRQPDFVTPQVFDWACGEARRKKGLDVSAARLALFDEGLCVQCLHTGPYTDEPATVANIEAYCQKNGLENDIGDVRRHHEIYLSDPKRSAPEKLKTVLRVPVKEK